MKVIVKGKFPGLNQIIAASKRHYACYSKMKKENTELFQWETKSFKPIDGKAIVNITWYFKNKRRDPDNIMAAQKFILDALVKNGVLKDDTIDYIHALNHRFVLAPEDACQIELIPYQPQPEESEAEQASLPL